MTKINNGGPAFPVPLNPGQSYQGHAPCDGMTLRDYFAAKAMQGLLAGCPDDPALRLEMNPKRWAFAAYAMADAMLAARGET